MEQIIDIAKQDLDTYKAEVLSLLCMDESIKRADLLQAYDHIQRLAGAIEDILLEEE